jgi:hypothetical protein
MKLLKSIPLQNKGEFEKQIDSQISNSILHKLLDMIDFPIWNEVIFSVGMQIDMQVGE